MAEPPPFESSSLGEFSLHSTGQVISTGIDILGIKWCGTEIVLTFKEPEALLAK